jgi:peptide/nickel transport system ATP-binding protein
MVPVTRQILIRGSEMTDLKEKSKLVEIRNLKVTFPLPEGDVHAVRGVDLVINRNEVLGIVGESGCGKSITAQSIMRIVDEPSRIDEGEMIFHFKDGKNVDIAKLKPKGKEIRQIRGKEISMIFQEPMSSFSPVYTIGKQLMEAVCVHQDVTKSEAREKVISLLTRVGISNAEKRVDNYPFEFSGGMRQRAMIAMALSSNPSLLIADEPTTALDVTIQAQILTLMKSIQEETDASIMFITHNLGVIAQIADRIAIMYFGKVVEEGTVEEIFDQPLHPYTIDLLKAVPRIDETDQELVAIEGSVPGPYDQVKGCAFHDRCSRMIPGKCDQDMPEVNQISETHRVRCWLHQD